MAAHGQRDRPANVKDLFVHLSGSCGYPGSYRSVLRYVRVRFGNPPMRTYRRVETVAGAQSQTDWGEYPCVDLGEGPEGRQAEKARLIAAYRNVGPIGCCALRLPKPSAFFHGCA